MENFKWTDEKVCEVSRIIGSEKSKSDVWTSDYTAELGIIKQYKLRSFYEEAIKDLGVTYLSHTNPKVEKQMIISQEKFQEFIQKITKYNQS
jgi:hypothetical protein